MNVRFFYDDALLELINFRGFLGGYGAVAPHPPQNSYSANAGPQWFQFSNGSDFINGAIQLVNENAPAIFISTTGWTKLFQVCFTINDPNIDLDQFCPPIVWDLEANPANGSFFSGSDGVVMTVANPTGGSLPANEAVNQFNWIYSGNGGAPYGNPYEITCSSVNCLPVVTCPANVVVPCNGSTLPAQTGTATAIDFCANGDPTISYTDALSGGTCPSPNLIIRTWAATDNCGNTGTCQQFISVGSNMCTKIVSSTANNGAGTLRYAIDCSNPGDTITFSTSIAGGTINISGSRIVIAKNLYIRSNVTPRIKVNSTISGLFEINPSYTVEFKDLDITSGLSYPGNLGAAFKNEGILKLVGMKVYKHASLPTGQFLVRNRPGSQMQCFGNCFIEIP